MVCLDLVAYKCNEKGADPKPLERKSLEISFWLLAVSFWPLAFSPSTVSRQQPIVPIANSYPPHTVLTRDERDPTLT